MTERNGLINRVPIFINIDNDRRRCTGRGRIPTSSMTAKIEERRMQLRIQIIC